MMRELSLFTGAGGGLLGSKLLGWKAIGYVEINDYCQRIIAQRIKDGILDDAPIYGDIRTFINEGYADAYKGMVDVITAGFPCQPFSVAGKQLGESDPRNMWPETLAVIRAVRPNYAFLENVPNLLVHKYFGRILGDLAECGYCVSWRCLSAAEMGAPHKRNRLWLVADSKWNIQQKSCNGSSGRMGRLDESMAWDRHWEDMLSILRRMDDGMAYRLDRTDAIRNGQVPIVVKAAWELLTNSLARPEDREG